MCYVPLVLKLESISPDTCSHVCQNTNRARDAHWTHVLTFAQKKPGLEKANGRKWARMAEDLSEPFELLPLPEVSLHLRERGDLPRHPGLQSH